jgi:hypothetical protein
MDPYLWRANPSQAIQLLWSRTFFHFMVRYDLDHHVPREAMQNVPVGWFLPTCISYNLFLPLPCPPFSRRFSRVLFSFFVNNPSLSMVSSADVGMPRHEAVLIARGGDTGA